MRRRQVVTNWDNVPVVLDIPYVMRVLGFGRDKVYDMVRNGELPAAPRVKGGSIRIYREELRKYIEPGNIDLASDREDGHRKSCCQGTT